MRLVYFMGLVFGLGFALGVAVGILVCTAIRIYQATGALP